MTTESQTPIPGADVRELIARSIWEGDPGNELPIVGFTWGMHRDQQIALGNESFLYAQADTVLSALVATTDVEIDAAIKRYGNTAWHQGFASGAKADIPEIEQRAEDRKAAGTMLRTLIAVRGPEARVVDLDTLQREDGEWANRTFPNASNDTIMSHLTEEVEELSNAAHIDNGTIGNIEEEAADCLLLLLHLAHRNHFSLFEEAQKKFEINKKRTWNVKAPGGHTKHDATPEELTHD
jgi:NTP pyrophosphatase (non-canonical NTP hydrolase)